MAKDNSKNIKYTKEEKLIATMLPTKSIYHSKLSDETGISQSTLATWKSKVTVLVLRKKLDVIFEKRKIVECKFQRLL